MEFIQRHYFFLSPWNATHPNVWLSKVLSYLLLWFGNIKLDKCSFSSSYLRNSRCKCSHFHHFLWYKAPWLLLKQNTIATIQERKRQLKQRKPHHSTGLLKNIQCHIKKSLKKASKTEWDFGFRARQLQKSSRTKSIKSQKNGKSEQPGICGNWTNNLHSQRPYLLGQHGRRMPTNKNTPMVRWIRNKWSLSYAYFLKNCDDTQSSKCCCDSWQVLDSLDSDNAALQSSLHRTLCSSSRKCPLVVGVHNFVLSVRVEQWCFDGQGSFLVEEEMRRLRLGRISGITGAISGPFETRLFTPTVTRLTRQGGNGVSGPPA